MADPQEIIAGLVKRGVPYPAAVGFAGNFAVESGFDTGINETNPVVPGSRGGFGLAQWTGPRRRQLEQYAGKNVGALDPQLDFLVEELNTTESGARDAIYSAQTPEEAARLVSERFLRPGVPHLDRRIAETRKLSGGSMPDAVMADSISQQRMGGQQRTAGGPQRAAQGQGNALAYLPPPQYRNVLDAKPFMLELNKTRGRI